MQYLKCLNVTIYNQDQFYWQKQAINKMDFLNDQLSQTEQFYQYHQLLVYEELLMILTIIRAYFIAKLKQQFYCNFGQFLNEIYAFVVSSCNYNLFSCNISSSQCFQPFNQLLYYQQYLSMNKSNKKCCLYQQCQQHLFSIDPCNQNTFEPIISKVSFCQQNKNKSNDQKERINESCCLNFASFNQDKDYRTPAFVLRGQNNAYNSSSMTGIKFKHQDHLDYSNGEKSQMFVPKPRSKNSYCSVCRTTFQDYQTHIYTSAHKQRIKNSRFNPSINRLVHKYNKHKRVLNSSPTINKLQHLPITKSEDDDSVQIIENPANKTKGIQKAQSSQSNKRKDKYKRNEQIPISYAQQLVNIFRGVNQQPIYTNYNLYSHFCWMMSPMFPNSMNYCFQKSTVTAPQPTDKLSNANKMTYIIIDQ